MTETQIKYFLKTCDTGSITAAADELSVTRSAVSKVIISLEEELCHQLFVRNKTGVVPTAAGEALYMRLDSRKNTYEAIKNYIIGLDNSSDDVINVGVTPTNIDAVYDILMEYQNRNKSHRINIREAKWDDLKELVLSGKVDIAFLPTRDPSHAFPEYTGIRVYTTIVCLAVSPDHPYADRDKIGVLDLVRTPLGYVSGVIPAERMIMKTCKAVVDTEPDIVIRSSSRALLHRLAKNGSIACIVSSALKNEWSDLVFIPMDFAPPVDHYLVWKEEKENLSIKELIKFILDRCPLD